MLGAVRRGKAGGSAAGGGGWCRGVDLKRMNDEERAEKKSTPRGSRSRAKRLDPWCRHSRGIYSCKALEAGAGMRLQSAPVWRALVGVARPKVGTTWTRLRSGLRTGVRPRCKLRAPIHVVSTTAEGPRRNRSFSPIDASSDMNRYIIYPSGTITRHVLYANQTGHHNVGASRVSEDLEDMLLPTL